MNLRLHDFISDDELMIEMEALGYRTDNKGEAVPIGGKAKYMKDIRGTDIKVGDHILYVRSISTRSFFLKKSSFLLSPR